jgi:arylsulfatase
MATLRWRWELFGCGAVRQDKYKLVHIDPYFGGRADGKWQLYDLEKDPGEVDDLAEKMSDKVKELKKVWEEYRKETGVVWGMPIKLVGLEWDGMEEEGYVGGDALGQTIAWMKVGAGQAPAEKSR